VLPPELIIGTTRGVDEDGGSGAFIHPSCDGRLSWNGASLWRGVLGDSVVGAAWWRSDLALATSSRHVADGSGAGMPPLPVLHDGGRRGVARYIGDEVVGR
jgi:hypothetical protein